MDKTYALSLYVDLRLGILTGKVVEPKEAYRTVKARYGAEAAMNCWKACDEVPRED